MNQAKAIREELAWIGRYLDGISPKLAKYQELTERKEFLRRELKKLPDRQSGTNPEPLLKKYKQGKRFITPHSSPDYTLELGKRKVDRLTVKRKY